MKVVCTDLLKYRGLYDLLDATIEGHGPDSRWVLSSDITVNMWKDYTYLKNTVG
jgi:hypothetical protein